MTLGGMAYVPVLKARQAEIKALLSAPTALEVTPLFELQQAASGGVDRKTGERTRAKSTATDASYFLDDIARLWSEPLYVDVRRVASGADRASWWRLLDIVNRLNPPALELIPVLDPSDDFVTRSAASGVARTSGRAALRIWMPDARTNPAVFSRAVAVVAKDVGVPAASVDVILDWGDQTEQYRLDVLEADTLAVVGALGRDHGRMATVGTPNSAAFAQVGTWAPPRREWWLWLRLAHAGVDVAYGDYALYPPTNPVPVSPKYGHLRYSSGDQMHVLRRAPAPGGGAGVAFQTCCADLTRMPAWRGAAFSSADQRIDDIANGADKENAAGKWREIAAVHHFTLVTEQLANPPAAPPAGTP